jgi:hypothetical protein
MKKPRVLGPFGIKLRLVRACPTGSVFIYLFIYGFICPRLLAVSAATTDIEILAVGRGWLSLGTFLDLAS